MGEGEWKKAGEFSTRMGSKDAKQEEAADCFCLGWPGGPRRSSVALACVPPLSREGHSDISDAARKTGGDRRATQGMG
jgi:hypothetical protein